MILTTAIMTFFLGSAAAYFLTHHYEIKVASARTKDIESRLRYAQHESLKLRETLATQKGEIDSLKGVLEQERTVHSGRYAQLSHSFKTALLFTLVGTFAVSSVLSGSLGWLSARALDDAKFSGQKAEMKYAALSFQQEKSGLENQIAVLTRKADDLNRQLLDQMVEKEVALAKLRILLESLSFQGGAQGFSLDFTKLHKNLKSHLDAKTIAQDLSGIKLS